MAERNQPDQQIGSGKAVTPKPTGLPEPQGLYHPHNEHDACGVGMICNIMGVKSRSIV